MPIGVEHGWIARADAVDRVLAALHFFSKSDQSGTTMATCFRGFHFHFLDIETGLRVWQSELSSIDTALLIAGMLTAALYFDADSAAETEFRQLADALYLRADWRWAQREGRVHQFSHAWIDFRGIRDRFMREKNSDYFENSRRATLVQRDDAIRNPRGFTGYGKDRWGLSAGDGPSVEPRAVAGRRQAFYGYAARGVPWGPDDGTIAGSSILASIVFAPEIALPAVRAMVAGRAGGRGESLRASGFNETARVLGSTDWLSEGEFALDQGLTVLMLENFRTGLMWQLTRRSPFIRAGLKRAGFKGGWLAAGLRD
jgi:hypothetical protein